MPFGCPEGISFKIMPVKPWDRVALTDSGSGAGLGRHQADPACLFLSDILRIVTSSSLLLLPTSHCLPDVIVLLSTLHLLSSTA